jgi:N-acetyl-anhydromuramyl-L-alanine amidase AmpD
MMPELYPGAIWRPSVINHPSRPDTLGIVIHWTVGSEAGDVTVLDGPTVDVHFYVAKDGDVYQFLPLDSQAWHAKFLANRHTIGIETEGRGEPWTAKQLDEVSKLTAWLCKRYGIPVRHTDPSGTDLSTFKGIFGHRDLSLGGLRVDGNDHTDTVPDGTGWDTFLAKVRSRMAPKKRRYYFERIKDGKSVMVWLKNGYAKKRNRDLHYIAVRCAHPTWALRKFSK